MRIWIFVFVTLAALGAGAFFWPSDSSVCVGCVQRGVAVDGVTGPFKVVAARDIILKAPIAGHIQSIILSPGDQAVETASQQTIATLALQDIQAQIEWVNKQIQELDTRLAADTPAGANLLATHLSNNFSTSPDERSHLQAHRDQLDAKLAWLHIQKNKHQLASGIAGMVIESYVSPGDWVNVGDPVARIVSHEKWLEVSLDEADCLDIKPGQPATVYLSAQPHQTFHAKVKNLQSLADAQTHRRHLYLTLEGSPQDLVVGMTGQASIEKSQKDQALLVPRRAIWGDEVLMVQNGRIHKQSVKVGYRGLQYVEIISGLHEGDSIVLDDIHLYHEGQKVIPLAQSQRHF